MSFTTLALTNIADGASITAAPHRNNYTAIQTSVNGINTALSSGAYTAYTPTWTASGTAPAIGNASVAAKYIQLGKFVHAYGAIIFGSTSTFGTGSFAFALPVASVGVTGHAGTAWIYDNSATALGDAFCQMASTTTFQLIYSATHLGTSTQVGQLAPWTWATSDQINWNLTYEAAVSL